MASLSYNLKVGGQWDIDEIISKIRARLSDTHVTTDDYYESIRQNELRVWMEIVQRGERPISRSVKRTLLGRLKNAERRTGKCKGLAASLEMGGQVEGRISVKGGLCLVGDFAIGDRTIKELIKVLEDQGAIGDLQISAVGYVKVKLAEDRYWDVDEVWSQLRADVKTARVVEADWFEARRQRANELCEVYEQVCHKLGRRADDPAELLDGRLPEVVKYFLQSDLLARDTKAMLLEMGHEPLDTYSCKDIALRVIDFVESRLGPCKGVSLSTKGDPIVGPLGRTGLFLYGWWSLEEESIERLSTVLKKLVNENELEFRWCDRELECDSRRLRREKGPA